MQPKEKKNTAPHAAVSSGCSCWVRFQLFVVGNNNNNMDVNSVVVTLKPCIG